MATLHEREEMRGYWLEHSLQANLDEMMLDTEADTISPQEAAEILSLLPSTANMDVLELGAGIGRFTGEFAKNAKSVTAVDFMESFVKENKTTNGHYGNTIFIQADVTQLKQESNSFDIIFTNWLLMYLDNNEVEELFNKMLSWLRPGGKLFFRESCFRQSGDKSRKSNPTHYRDPAFYNSIVQRTFSHVGSDKDYFAFELVFSKSIQTYIKLKGNPNQICWLVEKVKLKEGNVQGFKTFQGFLDNQQCSRNGILRYEKIFGRHFISTGGKDTTEEFVKMLDLKPGQKVLDVGSGIGGSAFYMAENHDVSVQGFDLSANMVSIAMERSNEIQDPRVQFEVADATKREFRAASFDVIYSRDTTLHIKDKRTLFANFFKWLRPGGKLLISDYCWSDGEHSDVFKQYVAHRGYYLLSVKNYGALIESVGFTNVMAEDRTDQFVNALKQELQRLTEIKDDFLNEFSLTDYDAIVDGWNDKLHRYGLGDQKWGLIYAEKR